LADAPGGIARVECYSGSKALETPRAFVLGGERREITRILDRARVANLDGRICERYRVVADGRIWILVRDPDKDLWTAKTEKSR